MRGGSSGGLFFGAGPALWSACTAEAASKAKPQISVETVKQAIESKTGRVQLVTFPDTGWSAVKIVRGGSPARDKAGQQPAAENAEIAEVVTFADSHTRQVSILSRVGNTSLGTPTQTLHTVA